MRPLPLTLAAPPPGEAGIGDLLADLPSRTIWLGVDSSVDPAGAVLLSDIQAIAQALDDVLADANTYTDSQIATRAPTVHTHVSTDITDFADAVEIVVDAIPGLAFVSGMIMMWSGLLTDIGVGPLAGWQLCNGTNGTPDLRDRFVLGAGGAVLPGGTNPAATLATTIAGQHSHGSQTGGHKLSTAELPAHSHTSGSLSGSISGTTNSAGSHTHAIDTVAPAGGSSSGIQRNGFGSAPTTTSTYTNSAGAHTHTVSGSCDISAGSTGQTGSTEAHDHTISTDGAHSHNVTSASLRNAIPYYALAYIMKL